MKKVFTLFLSLCLTVAMVSCGDDGDVGPQGEKGDAGTKGDTGAAGAAGADAQEKIGSIEGTITGTRRDETPISETFKFEYGQNDNDGEDYFYLQSYSDLTENSPYIYFGANIVDKGLPTESINVYDFYLYYTKEVSATTLFELRARHYYDNYPSSVTITNYVRNQTTGVITFDFAYESDGSSDSNSTENELTITGKFNSGSAIYTNVVGRKGE